MTDSLASPMPICLLCCKKRTAVYGCRFCPDYYYPGVDADYNHYRELRDEGHSIYQARVMAGLQDPDEVLNG